MKQNHNYKPDIINVLRDLTRDFPTQLLSTHLSIALADYEGKYDGISDKQLFFLFEKYKCEKELDISTHIATDDISAIIADGMNLSFTNLEDEDEDY